MQSDPLFVSADRVRLRSPLSVLATAPCVFFEPASCVRHDSWSRHGQIKRRRGFASKSLWNGNAGAVCSFDRFDFHFPSLTGGPSDGRFTRSAPLSVTVSRLSESRPFPRRPHGAGPENIWCLLWMTWKHLTALHQGKKSKSQCFPRWSVGIILWAICPQHDNNSNFRTDCAGGVQPIWKAAEQRSAEMHPSCYTGAAKSLVMRRLTA